MKSSKETFYFLLAAGILIRLFTLLFLPRFYAPDEEPHFKYAQYIHDYHELPVAYSATGAESKDWEYYQPPVYYLLISPLVSESTGISVMLLRLCSVILFAASFFLVRRIAELLNLSGFKQLIIFSFFCFLPTYVFNSSVINNDNLLYLVGLVIVYLTLSEELRSYKTSVIMGLWIALALLTKLSVLPIILFVTLCYIGIYLKKGDRNIISNLLLTGFIAMLFSLPFFLTNYLLYGKLIGTAFTNINPQPWKNSMKYLLDTASTMTWGFYANAGRINEIRPVIYPFGFVLMFLTLIGAFAMWKKKNIVFQSIILAFMGNILIVFWSSYHYHQAQGRFLLPSLLFFAVIFSFTAENLASRFSFFTKKRLLLILLAIFIAGYFSCILKIQNLKSEGAISAVMKAKKSLP